MHNRRQNKQCSSTLNLSNPGPGAPQRQRTLAEQAAAQSPLAVAADRKDRQIVAVHRMEAADLAHTVADHMRVVADRRRLWEKKHNGKMWSFSIMKRKEELMARKVRHSD